MRKDQYGAEFALVTHDSGFRDQRIVLQGTLNGLRRNEFSTRGLDQILLAVGNGEEALAIELSDVASLKPSVGESPLRLIRTVPIALKHRRAAHQDFAIWRDSDFEVG